MVIGIQGSLQRMESDSDLISNILYDLRKSDDSHSFDLLSQPTGTSLEQPFPETDISSKDPNAMVSGASLSLTASQLLPTETSRSSQFLQQEAAVLNGEWNFDLDQSSQLNSHYTHYQGNGALTGLYGCNTGDLTGDMHPPHWSESFPEYPELGQYDHQQNNTFSGDPSTFQLHLSAPPITSPDCQDFNSNSEPPASAVPKLSPERPTSAAQESDDLSPLSPADSLESYSLTSSNTQLSQMDNVPRPVPDIVNIGSEDDTDVDSVSSEEPYARLIFKALMSVPDHKMALKDIYDWFEKHTNKAKNSDTKGWQNSIRHNLSMNAAFEGGKEVTSSTRPQRKSGNVWVLTDQAIKNGVQSTTRYRKQAIHKKSQKSEHPAPQRQRSGAKGGRAARKSVRNRRGAQPSPDGDYRLPTEEITSHPRTDITGNYTTSRTDYIQPLSVATPRISLGLDDFSRIIECATLPSESPIFYHDDSPYFRNDAEFQVSTNPEVGPGFNYLGQVSNYCPE